MFLLFVPATALVKYRVGKVSSIVNRKTKSHLYGTTGSAHACEFFSHQIAL